MSVASSFERVRERTGDVAKVSWSNMSILPHYPGANLMGPRQSMVFSGTKRRTRRPSEPRFERANMFITDGPFLETKEHIGGFWILEAADMDEALA